MKKPRKLPHLSQRDIDVLTILWNSSHSMTASQIVDASPDLTMNTVQAVLRKLLKNNLIEVADIVYSGTVLSRSYLPAISSEDFAVAQLTDEYRRLKDRVSAASLFAAFIDEETNSAKKEEEIEQLEQILQAYKNSIQADSGEDTK
ncbi:MAG: BlaI/MecI/CopY family transcriptional regulator [Fusicatenibacter sp.]|nr:BlaI/MecI/CopY family transcriptional regulator [Fusicatenibacter sp.]